MSNAKLKREDVHMLMSARWIRFWIMHKFLIGDAAFLNKSIIINVAFQTNALFLLEKDTPLIIT